MLQVRTRVSGLLQCQKDQTKLQVCICKKYMPCCLSDMHVHCNFIHNKVKKKNFKKIKKDVGMKCQKASKQGVGIAETQS